MTKAVWNHRPIAESDACVTVEGNRYFPRESVDPGCLRESETRTVCAWKGVASYYHLVVDGRENRDAAWYYPEPKPDAVRIKDHIAFWRGVEIID